MSTARILGLGTASPPTSIENATIEAQLGLPDGWIEQRTGIQRRRELAPARPSPLLPLRRPLPPSTMPVCPQASSISCSRPPPAPTRIIPNLAPLIAGALGLTTAAYDVGLACTGILAGLQAAAAAVESGRARTVLLVGADAMRRWTDPAEGNTAAVFGDGAGALVLRASHDDGGIGAIDLGCDVAGREAVWIERATATFQMDGHATYRRAVSSMRAATEGVLARAASPPTTSTCFVYHQANRASSSRCAAGSGCPPSACGCNRRGRQHERGVDPARARRGAHRRPAAAGARVLVGAAGSGFCFGAGLLTW